MWTSTEQVSSLQRFASRYRELVISSNFWPVMLISALMLFMLLVSILLFFCADVYSVCRFSVYESVGEVLKFTIAVTHKITTIDKSQAAYGPTMEVDVWLSWTVSCMIFRNELNRMGQSKHS